MRKGLRLFAPTYVTGKQAYVLDMPCIGSMQACTEHAISVVLYAAGSADAALHIFHASLVADLCGVSLCAPNRCSAEPYALQEPSPRLVRRSPNTALLLWFTRLAAAGLGSMSVMLAEL